MKWHKYSPEEIEFLRINIPGRTHRDLTQMFNDRFGLDLSVTQVTAACKNRKYNNGLNGCFPKGNIPFNKGMKGLQMGGKETQFKKGHLPQNYMPVGSERINPYGNVDVKIADPNKWRSKAALTWEAAHGPVPPGHGSPRNGQLEQGAVTSCSPGAVRRYAVGG
jgi:hypothetical protein